MSGIPPLLRGMDAVVAPLVAPDGRLLDANAGFLRLLGAGASVGAPVAAFFRNPTFSPLHTRAAAAASPPMPLQVGSGTAVGWTLHGSITRSGQDVLLVAEHDVLSLERLAEEALRLNEQLAEAQRTLHRQNRQLQSSEQSFRELSGTDVLTGLANRRRLDEQLEHHLDRHRRYADPLSVIAVDIDNFKQVNDTYGHAAGDEVIRRVGLALAAGARECDLVARIGGEEFVVMLPSTSLEAAFTAAERLVHSLRDMIVAPLEEAVTVSCGVSTCTGGDTPELLLHRADAALYVAKRGGRDRAVSQPAP